MLLVFYSTFHWYFVVQMPLAINLNFIMRTHSVHYVASLNTISRLQKKLMRFSSLVFCSTYTFYSHFSTKKEIDNFVSTKV